MDSQNNVEAMAVEAKKLQLSNSELASTNQVSDHRFETFMAYYAYFMVVLNVINSLR